MIEVDPRIYFPKDYVVQCNCPNCGTEVRITLGEIDGTPCPECPEELSLDEILALREFDRCIA